MLAAADCAADACGGIGVTAVAVAAQDVPAGDTGFFAVVAALDVVETDAIAGLVEMVVVVAVVTPSSHCTPLRTSLPEEPSSLSAVGRGVLGVTVKDGTSGGSSVQPADKSRSFGERCSGEGGLTAEVVAVSSSSLSTRLSTSLCE